MNKYETLRRAAEVVPLAVKDGIEIMGYDEAVLKQQAEIIEDEPDIAGRKLNPNGTIARSKTTIAATNKNLLFLNRYRVLENEYGDRILQVVTDYRAIKEQATGNIYIKNIPCVEIRRDSDGALILGGYITVSDEEFVREFTRRIDDEGMLQVLSVIDNASDITADPLGI